jgi:hypothetical protein
MNGPPATKTISHKVAKSTKGFMILRGGSVAWWVSVADNKELRPS